MHLPMAVDTDLLLFAGRAAMLAVAFIAFAVALTRWRRAGTRDMQALMTTLDESRTETRGLAELTASLAMQLATLQQKLDERTQLAQATMPANAGGIDLAVRLARQGSDVDEIVKTCGVTRNEAQLLARLHVAEAHRQA
jgi:uncharacterized protein YoxC